MVPEGIQEFRPEKVDDLAPKEREVIEFMLNEGPKSWTLSSRELAEKADTSGVTVVRAAKALGYPKLSHLRLALADYWREKNEPRLDERFDATIADAPNGLLDEEIEVGMSGLKALRQRVSQEDFEEQSGSSSALSALSGEG